MPASQKPRPRRPGRPSPCCTASSQGSAAPFPARMASSQGIAAPARLSLPARHLRKETPCLLALPFLLCPALTQGNATPVRPPSLRMAFLAREPRAFPWPPSVLARKRSALPWRLGFPARRSRAFLNVLLPAARLPRKGAPRLHDRSRAAFPCAAPLLRKGAPRLSLAAFPRSTRLPRKETLGLHDRPFFPPHGFLAMERCGGTSFPAPRGFIARERCGVIPALASLGFPRKGALRLSGLSLAARPRRNRPRGALAPRGLLRSPLVWLVFRMEPWP